MAEILGKYEHQGAENPMMAAFTAVNSAFTNFFDAFQDDFKRDFFDFVEHQLDVAIQDIAQLHNHLNKLPRNKIDELYNELQSYEKAIQKLQGKQSAKQNSQVSSDPNFEAVVKKTKTMIDNFYDLYNEVEQISEEEEKMESYYAAMQSIRND